MFSNSPADLFLASLVIMGAWMSLLWIFAWRRNEADIVDLGWAAGVGIVAVMYAAHGSGELTRRVALAVLVGAWSLRLSLYIFSRVIEPGEDGRYAQLRESWGRSANIKIYLFCLMQGALVSLLSIPFIAVVINPKPFGTLLDFLAVAISMTSIIGETIADIQLKKFRHDRTNRGKVCEVGLWRYSRHPNYFFEWFHWISYILLAVGSPLFPLSPLSAVIMLYLILKVTGIPPTEARSLVSRGDAYREYQKNVSPFVPWFRRDRRADASAR